MTLTVLIYLACGHSFSTRWPPTPVCYTHLSNAPPPTTRDAIIPNARLGTSHPSPTTITQRPTVIFSRPCCYLTLVISSPALLPHLCSFSPVLFHCLRFSLACVFPSPVLFPRTCCSLARVVLSPLVVLPCTFLLFVLYFRSWSFFPLAACTHALISRLCCSLVKASRSLVSLSRSRCSSSRAAPPLALLYSSCCPSSTLFSRLCSPLDRAAFPLVQLFCSR